MTDVAFGNSVGPQAKPGKALGKQWEGFHGSWRGGIDELLPSSQVGWANHVASHPDKVYAADTEEHAWTQAEYAASKRIGEQTVSPEHVDPQIQPTVYETTLRGKVTSDPEYDATAIGVSAARGDFGEVTGELTMPPGSQGTLLPDYAGRTGQFSRGRSGMVHMRDHFNDVPMEITGARYERIPDDAPSGPVYDTPAITPGSVSHEPYTQQTTSARDRGVEAVVGNPAIFREAPAELRDAARAEQKKPRLFPLSEARNDHTDFPYGKPAGWDSRMEAFRRG